MKLVKNFVLAVLLASALAVNTPAGDVQIPAYVPPPPPKPDSVVVIIPGKEEEPTPKGDESDNIVETTDFLMYEALKALLSLF